MEKENKGRAIALLPIGVFLIIFLGAGIVFEDFYAMRYNLSKSLKCS